MQILDSRQAKARDNSKQKPPANRKSTSLMPKKPKSDKNKLVKNFGHSVASNLQAKANSMNHRSTKQRSFERTLRYDLLDLNK